MLLTEAAIQHKLTPGPLQEPYKEAAEHGSQQAGGAGLGGEVLQRAVAYGACERVRGDAPMR